MSGKVAYIGDVHLEQDDPLLPAFLAFLDGLGRSHRQIVLIGDLFDLWIGRAELEQAHHRQVAAKFRELRARGVVLSYVEGNRDYRIADLHLGGAFDTCSAEGLITNVGGCTILAIHGDLANRDDRQYRSWRRFSRSTWVWALFNAIPVVLRQRFAARLERRMRTSNLGFKREFPKREVLSYADEFLAQGHAAVVLGHFHEEHALEASAGGRVWVLPEWKGSRRHLEASEAGIRFVDSAMS